MEHLSVALQIPSPDIVQKAGIIHFFEMSFELAWNTLKDYLENQGFTEIKSPRQAIKKAFEIGLIGNGHTWLKILEDRNLTAHAYEEEVANQIELIIRQEYYPLFNGLLHQLNTKQDDK